MRLGDYQKLSCRWSGLWVNWHYYFSHNTLIPFLSLTHSLCSEPAWVRKLATVSLFHEKVAAELLFQDCGLTDEVKDLQFLTSYRISHVGMSVFSKCCTPGLRYFAMHCLYNLTDVWRWETQINMIVADVVVVGDVMSLRTTIVTK